MSNTVAAFACGQHPRRPVNTHVEPVMPTFRFLLGACFWAVFLLAPLEGHAYPWMLKHGFAKCSTCHTDPSGGETLSHMGRVQGEELMTTRWGQSMERSKFLFGVDEPDAVRLGGSFRFMSIYSLPKDGVDAELESFPMQMDFYGTGQLGSFRAGASVGYAEVPEGSPHLRAAQVTSEPEGANLISRWHWLGYEFSERLLVRAGRLNLPYGIRVSEHVLWAKDLTKTDRESDQQHGLAVAYWKGAWRSEVMFVLGNYQLSPDAFRQRGYSAFVEYLLGTNLALGLNSQVLQSQEDRFLGRDRRTIRHAHGLMSRYAATRSLVFLAEASFLKTSSVEPGFAGFLIADYEPVQGLHLTLTGEAADAGKPEAGASMPGAGETLFGAWATLAWFFYSHMDLRVDLVLRDEAPARLQAQYHLYF